MTEYNRDTRGRFASRKGTMLTFRDLREEEEAWSRRTPGWRNPLYSTLLSHAYRPMEDAPPELEGILWSCTHEARGYPTPDAAQDAALKAAWIECGISTLGGSSEYDEPARRNRRLSVEP